MTQPGRVLYLPPGVATPVAGPAAGPSGVPFDRSFFEQILPSAVASFCRQVDCGQSPLVELLTVDGVTHYVKGISGVADGWVALHTTDGERDDAVQLFIPYQTIFRVAVHAADPTHRHLGFALNQKNVTSIEGPGVGAAKDATVDAAAANGEGAEAAPAARSRTRKGATAR